MNGFHVDRAVLRAYAEGRLADTDAWSIEAHLDRCAACRTQLPLDTGTQELVVAVGAALRTRLNEPGRVRPGSWWRRVTVLVGAGPAARTGWLLSVVVTSALTLGLAISPYLIRPWLLLLIVPALPVLGIAVSYGRHTDPLHELIAASPYGGLRIILWRTLSVVAVTVPVVLVAGTVAGIGAPGMWLLPCIAMTTLTLGLSFLIDVEKAGLSVAAGWAALVLAPFGDAVVVAPASGPAWLLVIAVSVALLVLRRSRMGNEVAR